MDKKSFFLVLDGIDGSGTTTHSKMLVSYLEMLGLKVHLTQEPSKNEIGLLLRQYLKNNEIPASTDALLFAADRDLHYKKEIQPKLDQGFIVVSDRYIESSIIYQSVQSEEISIEWIKQINKFARSPDLTIILDIDPKISLARKSQEILEKFEDTKFLNKVRTLYLNRATEEGYYIVKTDDIIEIVQQNIQTIVIKKLKEKGF